MNYSFNSFMEQMPSMPLAPPQGGGFIDPSTMGGGVDGDKNTHADLDIYKRALNIDDDIFDKVVDGETTTLANIRDKGVVYGPVPVVIMGKPFQRGVSDPKTGQVIRQNMIKVKVLASKAGQNAFRIDKDSESGYGKLPYKPEDKIMEIPVEDIINFGRTQAPPSGGAPPGGGMSLMASAKFVGFKQWLHEVGTSTGSIASFPRMIGPEVRRQFAPSVWNVEDPFFKKKNFKKEQ